MDTPSVEVLLKVVRSSSWRKAKNNLAETLPEGSEQRAAFTDAIEQLVEHIESNKLHV